MSRGIRYCRTSEDVCPSSSNIFSQYTYPNAQYFLIAGLCPLRDLISMALCRHSFFVATYCAFLQLAMMLLLGKRDGEVVVVSSFIRVFRVTLSSYLKPPLDYPPQRLKSFFLNQLTYLIPHHPLLFYYFPFHITHRHHYHRPQTKKFYKP